MDERDQLCRAIEHLEEQRALLGDAVVDSALAPLRERLALLERRAHAEQRKQAVVLFADVSGFTAATADMDPEDVHDAINALWTRMDRIIVEHGGAVDKHIGDAVMAIFGLPEAHEDDAERAVRAALAMQTAQSAAQSSGPDFRLRIAVHSGLVLLGEVGTTGEYTALGDAVNVASRLQQAAPVGGVLISESVYRLVRGLFEVRPQPLLLPKGKAEPLQTYLVLREKDRAFYMPTRGLAGVCTRTVGRESELAALQEAYLEAQERREVRWITISGEAGVGKSRLVAEFEHWMELRPERIWHLRARAWPHTAHVPYHLLRELLSFRFLIRDGDPPAAAREKLTAGLAEALGPAGGEEAAAFIGQLIGFGMESSPWIAPIVEDSRQIRGRAGVLLRQYLAELCARGPVVLLLEDLHWSDKESLVLLGSLLSEAERGPLCAVGATRPEFWERDIAWAEKEQARQRRLDLAPLDEQHTIELARELLQKVPAPPEWLIDLLVERGGGNPYFTEELVHWLIEQEVLETGTDTWQVREEHATGLSVPRTVQAVLQARLERLIPAGRQALQQAAVIGRVFWRGAVDHIAGAAVPDGLWEELQRRDLIYRQPATQLPGQEEYHFKHALLRDVVYEYTLKKQRPAYHRRAAEWLAQASGERAGEWAAVIAGHYRQAGDRQLAAEWYGRAGKQAQEADAPAAAIGYYEQALDLLPETEETARQRLPLLRGLAAMLQRQARYRQALEVLANMQAAAAAAGDQEMQVWSQTSASGVHCRMGDLPAAMAAADQAEEIARTAGDRTVRAQALIAKAWVLYHYGEGSRVLDLTREALGVLGGEGGQMVIASAWSMAATGHWILGNYAEAAAAWEQALAICRTIGDRYRTSSMLNNLGANAYMRGDYGAAADIFREALEISRSIGSREAEALYRSNLGGALAGRGEHAQAAEILKSLLAEAGDGGYEAPNSYRFLAEACMGLGRVDEAEAAARQSLAISQRMAAQDLLGRAWRMMGQVARARGQALAVGQQTYTAADCFAESLHIFTARGAAGERARTLREWARLELAEGDATKGAAMWDEARDLFVRLGMELEVQRMDAEKSCRQERTRP